MIAEQMQNAACIDSTDTLARGRAFGSWQASAKHRDAGVVQGRLACKRQGTAGRSMRMSQGRCLQPAYLNMLGWHLCDPCAHLPRSNDTEGARQLHRDGVFRPVAAALPIISCRCRSTQSRQPSQMLSSTVRKCPAYIN